MRVGDVAKQLGVSSSAVRVYCNDGRLESSRNPGGQRHITQEAVDKFLGKTEQGEIIAHYVRSSSGDASLLQSQTDELISEYGNGVIYKDRSSGLNDKRPGLWRMIRDAEEGKFNTLCITHEDRLTRFNYHFLEHILSKSNVQIKVLYPQVRLSLEDELLADFMSIISVFSGKFYRLRSNESKNKLLEQARKELND